MKFPPWEQVDITGCEMRVECQRQGSSAPSLIHLTFELVYSGVSEPVLILWETLLKKAMTRMPCLHANPSSPRPVEGSRVLAPSYDCHIFTTTKRLVASRAHQTH